MACGWLSPRGKFYPCGISEHIYFAKKLFLDSKNPEKHIEDLHWIKITPDYILGNLDNGFVDPKKVTQSQLDWLYDFCEGKESSWMQKEMFKDILRDK